MQIMTKRLRALILVALSAEIQAQSYITIPPGYITQESYPHAAEFGAYPDMRFQIVDRDIFTPMVVLEIACRRDGYQDASSVRFAGRTWASVQLVMGEHDRITTTAFSTNLVTNVTRVFSGSVTWPDHSAGPRTSVPHAWAIDVAFPFSAPWSYSASSSGVTVDFAFSGGSLTNQSTWNRRELYLLDGTVAGKEALGQGFGVGDFSNPRCQVATSFGGTPWAFPNAVTTATGSVSCFGRLQSYPYSANTLYAYSVSGDSAGVPIGLRCQNFFLGAGPFVFAALVTPSTGFQFDAPGAGGIPYRQEYVGMKVWTQAVFLDGMWRDTLSAAGYSQIQPRPLAALNAVSVWAASTTKPIGTPLSVVPVLRLSRR